MKAELIRCGSCGAPLSVGGVETVRCEYCGFQSRVVASSEPKPERTGPTLNEALAIQATEDIGIVVVAVGTVVPVTRTELITTSRDNQDTITLTLRAGNAERPVDNRLVGSFVIPIEKRGPRGTIRVGLTLRIELDGALTVGVKEEGRPGVSHDGLTVAINPVGA